MIDPVGGNNRGGRSGLLTETPGPTSRSCISATAPRDWGQLIRPWHTHCLPGPRWERAALPALHTSDIEDPGATDGRPPATASWKARNHGTNSFPAGCGAKTSPGHLPTCPAGYCPPYRTNPRKDRSALPETISSKTSKLPGKSSRHQLTNQPNQRVTSFQAKLSGIAPRTPPTPPGWPWDPALALALAW
jgi:hypothetical protein